MPSLLTRTVRRFAMEPPFRVLAREACMRLPVSLRTKALWDAVARPHYLHGLLSAADEARREGVSHITSIEFGVAGGVGLLLMQSYAELVERETGVGISVYGFDLGDGLPQPRDYRDHADWWIAGDYPMDEASLRGALAERTQLVLGDVAETVPRFVDETLEHPIGFIAFDLDLYNSTRDAMCVLTDPKTQILRRVVIYFDDIRWYLAHRFAGELLAIDEVNEHSEFVKIDHWHGVKNGGLGGDLAMTWRPFPDAWWLDSMYQAHDLSAVSASAPERAPWNL